MKILTASSMGFCRGVRRALDLIEQELMCGEPIHVLGPLVHNAAVVADLEARGALQVSTLDAVPDGGTVAVTAHGAAPETFAEITRRGLVLVDTTCPFVSRAQRVARRLASENAQVVVFGEADHREVRGILAHAGKRALAALSAGPDLDLGPGGVGVLSQTTRDPLRFEEFVRELRRALGEEGARALSVADTTCPETTQRYAEARRWAAEVDAYVIVGSSSSANTHHLARVGRETGRPTYLLESADELPEDLFSASLRVGVLSGASTPDATVAAVLDRLRAVV